MLGGVFEGHGGQGLEDTHLRYLRRGTGSGQRHRGGIRKEPKDPLLVPQARQHPLETAR